MADNDARLAAQLAKTIHRLAIAGVSLTGLLVGFALGVFAGPRHPDAAKLFALILAGLFVFVCLYAALTTMLVRWIATKWEHVALIHVACAGACLVPVAAALLMTLA